MTLYYKKLMGLLSATTITSLLVTFAFAEEVVIEHEPEVDTASPNLDDFSLVPTSTPTILSSVSPLQMDIYEFIDLVPVNEVNELRIRYYLSDSNIRKAYDFISKYNYTFVHTQLIKLIEVKKALRFFEEKNVNLTEIGETLYERLGPLNLPDLVIEPDKPNSGGFYAMLDSILDEIPQDEVVTLFFEKLETSHDFAELFDWIRGTDFKEMLNVLRFNKEVQRFVYGLRNNGVDVIKVFKLLKSYFGFGFKK